MADKENLLLFFVGGMGCVVMRWVEDDRHAKPVRAGVEAAVKLRRAPGRF